MIRSLALTLLAALLLVPAAYAQNDPKAEAVLERVRIKMRTVRDFRSQIKITLENREIGDKTSRSGTVKFKSNQYRVELADQELISNGASVWTYDKTFNEVTITDYDPEASFSVNRMFTIYEEGMNARWDAQENTLTKITLFPKGNNSEYFKIELWVDANQNLPRKMAVYNRNGSVVTYELNNPVLNSNIPDSEFVFNTSKHSGVQIIDMRY